MIVSEAVAFPEMNGRRSRSQQSQRELVLRGLLCFRPLLLSVLVDWPQNFKLPARSVFMFLKM